MAFAPNCRRVQVGGGPGWLPGGETMTRVISTRYDVRPLDEHGAVLLEETAEYIRIRIPRGMPITVAGVGFVLLFVPGFEAAGIVLIGVSAAALEGQALQGRAYSMDKCHPASYD